MIERALTPAGAWILDDLHSPDALGVVRRVMRQRDVATARRPRSADERHLRRRTHLRQRRRLTSPTARAARTRSRATPADDHLEGSASDDTITGNEGRDDIIGGTGRTFSNDESTATAGRIDNPAGDDAANDTLHGGNGLGAVAADDDDVIAADNATIDRARGTLGTPAPS